MHGADQGQGTSSYNNACGGTYKYNEWDIKEKHHSTVATVATQISTYRASIPFQIEDFRTQTQGEIMEICKETQTD